MKKPSPVFKFKRIRLPANSWAYRIKVLKPALGWSYGKIAAVMGVRYNTLTSIIYKHQSRKGYTPMLQFDTIRKITHFERVYALEIKRYKQKGESRLWTYQKYLLKPKLAVPIREFNYPEALALLAAEVEDPNETPEALRIRKRNRYRRASKAKAQTWARKIAEGWRPVANHKKTQLGRSNNAGTGTATVDNNIPTETPDEKAPWE